MKLSILIPVYDEEKTINYVIDKVNSLHLPKRVKKEIIVVDDASEDLTFKKINHWLKKGVIIIRHDKNQGKGAAIRTGLSKSTGELFIIQDADLEYNPQDYSKLLEPILQNRASVVYGTRLMNYPLNLWGKNKTVLPTHLIANKFLTLLTNLLFNSNLTDMETGYKVFKKKALKGINLRANKFDFEAEITAKILKKGIRIVEIPIITKPRTYEEGKKIGWKDGISAIWTLIKYRFVD